jgi:hypothetical protein
MAAPIAASNAMNPGDTLGDSARLGRRIPGEAVSRRPWSMRAVIQAGPGKAEEEPIAALFATTTTPPGTAWAPIRAAERLRETA